MRVYTESLPADSAHPPPAGDPGGLHGNYFNGHGDAALARVQGIFAPPLRALDPGTPLRPLLTPAVVGSQGSVAPRGRLGLHTLVLVLSS